MTVVSVEENEAAEGGAYTNGSREASPQQENMLDEIRSVSVPTLIIAIPSC